MSHTQRQKARRDLASESCEAATSENPHERLIALVEEWLADDSGYDERVAPLLEEELRSHPLAIG